MARALGYLPWPVRLLVTLPVVAIMAWANLTAFSNKRAFESMQEELGAWTQREAAAWWSDAGAIPRRPLNEHGLPETLVLPPDRLRTPSKDP